MSTLAHVIIGWMFVDVDKIIRGIDGFGRGIDRKPIDVMGMVIEVDDSKVDWEGGDAWVEEVSMRRLGLFLLVITGRTTLVKGFDGI